MEKQEPITVVHATAPTCWWSWGYEPVFNRLNLVYGDQIKVIVIYLTVYEDIEQYRKDYELNDAGMVAWAKEAKEIMGMPMHIDYKFEQMPKSVFPATLAVLAANRQGSEKGHRLYRAILRRSIVENQDVSEKSTILEAAGEAGLEIEKFKRDLSDDPGLRADYENQGEDGPPVHVGFYNIGVTDRHGRTVYLDQQFQPSVVEGAIDYLADGRLRKAKPHDIEAFLRAQGPTPLVEVERVFGLSLDEADAEMTRLEKDGRAKRSTLAGSTFWHV